MLKKFVFITGALDIPAGLTYVLGMVKLAQRSFLQLLTCQTATDK